ncbi:MAG: lipoprotein [Desulfonatronovibrio sp.]
MNNLYFILRMLALIIIALLCISLTGCGPKYPLGIPEENWQNMNEQDRLRAREKQAELNLAQEKRRKAEAEERTAESIKWLKDLEVSRENARYGQRVQCVLSNAQAYFWGEWRDIEPVALDIVKGMVLKFDILQAGDKYGFEERAYAGFDGQTISLCREESEVQHNARSCARVAANFKQYARGLKTTIKKDKFLRARIRCDLAPGKGMPLRLP